MEEGLGRDWEGIGWEVGEEGYVMGVMRNKNDISGAG